MITDTVMESIHTTEGGSKLMIKHTVEIIDIKCNFKQLNSGVKISPLNEITYNSKI